MKLQFLHKWLVLGVWVMCMSYQSLGQFHTYNDAQKHLQLKLRLGKKGINYGPKMGLLYNNITQNVDSELGTSGRIGLLLGGFVNFRMGRRFSFRHELLLSSRGFNLKDGGEKIPIAYRYLDFPWMVNFHFRNYLIFGVGVKPSLHLFTKNPSSSIYDEFEKGNIKPLDFAVIAGMEYVTPEEIGIGLRFSKGFISSVDIPDMEAYSYSIELALSYNFIIPSAEDRKLMMIRHSTHH